MSPDDWRNHPNYSIDPCDDVQPALLNSVHIKRYGHEGCLVTDFDPERVNPASYTMCLLGILYWWERKRKRLVQQQQPITDGTPVTLPRNSISYLLTAQEFRLPQYIAARFNLHIRHVHKGILLGTGPLVDPGFAGPLLIPLHNLTDNDYRVPGGNPIIWVEFTKLSPLDYWTRDLADIDQCPPAGFVTFLPRKYDLTADDYFKKALDLSVSAIRSKEGVQSAFKGALDSAEEATREADRTTKWVRNLGFAGLAGGAAVIVAVIALVIQAVSLIVNANDVQASTQALIQNLNTAPSSADPSSGQPEGINRPAAGQKPTEQETNTGTTPPDSDPGGHASTSSPIPGSSD